MWEWSICKQSMCGSRRNVSNACVGVVEMLAKRVGVVEMSAKRVGGDEMLAKRVWESSKC